MTYAPNIEAALWENWPDEVRAASIPTVELSLSIDESLALAANNLEFRLSQQMPGMPDLPTKVRSWIQSSLETYPGGLFLKSSYGAFRSPLAMKPAETFAECEGIIRSVNGRVLRYLQDRIRCRKPALLLARQWRDMPLESEFRVFTRNEKIIGICPYHFEIGSPRLSSQISIVDQKIRIFVRNLLPYMKGRSMIFDVGLDFSAGGDAYLIELTPFAPQADPCLFNWRADEFRGQFRFQSGTTVAEHFP